MNHIRHPIPFPDLKLETPSPERPVELASFRAPARAFQVSGQEKDLELEFEEPQLITLGYCYRKRGRFSGGAYQPALKRVDSFLGKGLRDAAAERERLSDLVLELDDAVNEAVQKLKAKGLVSPYLKAFVVARVNPLRFIKGDYPSFEELMKTMTRRARGMNPDKVRSEDLSRSGGVPDEES